MGLIGFINIGMGVNTSGLSRGLKQASAEIDGFADRVGRAGRAAAVALGAIGVGAGVALGAGLTKAIRGASDLNEQLSKTGVVFGPASAAVIADAEAMAKSFGTSKNEYLEAASNIGLIAKGSGLDQAAAAELSTGFARLAADAASFYNTDFETALGKIRSGLVGESEPIRAFGVLLNEEAVKAEAARMGLAALGQELTEGMKVQARAALITRGLADAQGDMERTSAGAANMTRTISGRIQNLAADLGSTLLPVTEAVLGSVSSGLMGLATSIESNKAAVAAWAGTLVGHIETVGVVVRNWGAFTEEVWLRGETMMANFGQRVAWLGETFQAFGSWVASNIPTLIGDGFRAALAIVTNEINDLISLLDFARRGFTDLGRLKDELNTNINVLDVAKTPAFKAPKLELFDVGAQVKGIQDRIAKAELKQIEAPKLAIATPKAALGPGLGAGASTLDKAFMDESKGTPLEAPKVAAEALQLGSADFRSKVLRFEQQGGGKGKGLEDVAKNTSKQIQVQQDTHTTLKRLVEKGLQVADYSF